MMAAALARAHSVFLGSAFWPCLFDAAPLVGFPLVPLRRAAR